MIIFTNYSFRTRQNSFMLLKRIYRRLSARQVYPLWRYRRLALNHRYRSHLGCDSIFISKPSPAVSDATVIGLASTYNLDDYYHCRASLQSNVPRSNNTITTSLWSRNAFCYPDHEQDLLHSTRAVVLVNAMLLPLHPGKEVPRWFNFHHRKGWNLYARYALMPTINTTKHYTLIA